MPLGRKGGWGMRWDINLSEVAELIGTIYGVANATKTDIYISNLMKAAHSDAAKQFNVDIASQAIATQRFNHMYEWGTAGINKGRTTRQMNPLNPEAMLWRHKLSGQGKHKAIDWTYRASKVPVPQPTVSKTGVARKYLDKLSGRKHIFYWKAPIIEQGMKVKLRPKYANMIFVPFYNQPRSPKLSPADRKKGFLFHKGPLTNVPSNGTIQGRDLAGNFTAFWEEWWNSSGSTILQEKMYSAVNADVRDALEAAGAKRGKSVTNKEWTFEIKTAQKTSEAFLQARAKAIAQKEKMEGEVW